jgi:hypothetical protein
MEKNKNTMKGPPPPVAPKPSWPRQTSTAAAAVIPPTVLSSPYSQINDENKIINDISHSNITVAERQPSQKFNRSSSMNQISTNIIQQQEITPPRNKSHSIPDSRFIDLKNKISFTKTFFDLDFQKVFILMHFVLLVS